MTETELKNLLKTVAPPDEAARAAGLTMLHLCTPPISPPRSTPP